MKVLIIADVHANKTALDALPEADTIICAGDIVTFGAEPNACIDWLRAHNALCIRGEEDDAVAHGTRHALPQRLAAAGIASRKWTRLQLTGTNEAWLADLPPELTLTIGRLDIGVVHAYPGDYNRYLMPTEEELERLTRAFPKSDIIVTGHTHRQGIWHRRGVTVINPGSVGQNAVAGLASYALLDSGRIMFGSARYDVGRAMDRIFETALPLDAQSICVRELIDGGKRPESRLPWPVHTVPD
jgi:putative phosphoesterase